jgi:tRNA G10  N-methylase Trm11
VGEVFARVKKNELEATIINRLSLNHESGKLNYGVSIYGWSEKNLRPLLLDLKKEFKSRNLSSRFANQSFLNLSSAQYKGLDGTEILVAKQGEDFYVAEVVAVQNIDAYSKRDYEKPFRDMKVGMQPPKLAQIMINLAGKAKIIWDPFCGGGGLVMEGLLMGHPMLGSDINEKTLKGAQQNIDWIRAENKIKHEAELFVHDATQPLLKRKFDAVVCEGYLGPPQTKLKSKRELAPVVSELTALYRHFFTALKKSGFEGVIVIGLPFYQTREGGLYLDEAVSLAEAMGYKMELSLEYARKDQLVGRHILRFRLGA